MARVKTACAALFAASIVACASGSDRYGRLDRPTEGIFLEEPEASVESAGLSPVRSVTEEGLALLKEFEGEFRCREDGALHCPYDDASDFCTIGHGHLIAKSSCSDIEDLLDELEFRSGVDDERAGELLLEDLAAAQLAIESNMIDGEFGATGISDFQYDALTSFVFNVGSRNFRNSTLLKELNLRSGLGENEEIAFQFSRWTKSNGRVLAGLATRRKKETLHFFRGFPLAELLAEEGLEASAADEAAAVDILLGEE
jgi:lysozyme